MTQPADLDDDELEAALTRLATERAAAPTATRKLVIGTVIDRLLEEKWARSHQAVSQ